MHAGILLRKAGAVTASAAPEVSRLTAEMIADSDKGFDTDFFAELESDKDQTEEN